MHHPTPQGVCCTAANWDVLRCTMLRFRHTVAFPQHCRDFGMLHCNMTRFRHVEISTVSECQLPHAAPHHFGDGGMLRRNIDRRRRGMSFKHGLRRGRGDGAHDNPTLCQGDNIRRDAGGDDAPNAAGADCG